MLIRDDVYIYIYICFACWEPLSGDDMDAHARDEEEQNQDELDVLEEADARMPHIRVLLRKFRVWCMLLVHVRVSTCKG